MSRLGRTAVLAVLAALLCVPAAQAAFPGANGRIAYTLLVDENPDDGVLSGQTDTFTAIPGEFTRTNLTQSPFYETNPSWSADGHRMVVNVASSSGSGLFTMDDQGGDLKYVASVRGGHFPVLSPDGTRIAFGEAPSGNDNNYEVSVINVDGTGYTNLTQSPGVDLAPSWSPDGTRIAFNSARAGGAEIYTMKADGSDVTRVTTSGLNLDPDWSPDGSRIAFMDASGDGDIHVINADGTNEVNLGAPGYQSGPAWSPDGRQIAYVHGDLGTYYEIYVMNANGSNPTRVTWSESSVGTPSWQPRPADASLCDHVSVRPRVLSPADRRFVKLFLAAPSALSAAPVLVDITGVTQDEPTGRVQDALPAHRPERVRVKAEAGWRGNGRVYEVSYTASAGTAEPCSGTVQVSVPRGEWPPAADSAPPSYDSFVATAP